MFTHSIYFGVDGFDGKKALAYRRSAPNLEPKNINGASVFTGHIEKQVVKYSITMTVFCDSVVVMC
jgi:hypothetical protein